MELVLYQLKELEITFLENTPSMHKKSKQLCMNNSHNHQYT